VTPAKIYPGLEGAPSSFGVTNARRALAQRSLLRRPRCSLGEKFRSTDANFLSGAASQLFEWRQALSILVQNYPPLPHFGKKVQSELESRCISAGATEVQGKEKQTRNNATFGGDSDGNGRGRRRCQPIDVLGREG